MHQTRQTSDPFSHQSPHPYSAQFTLLHRLGLHRIAIRTHEPLSLLLTDPCVPLPRNGVERGRNMLGLERGGQQSAVRQADQ
jgi:hypothetical protein